MPPQPPNEEQMLDLFDEALAYSEDITGTTPRLHTNPDTHPRTTPFRKQRYRHGGCTSSQPNTNPARIPAHVDPSPLPHSSPLYPTPSHPRHRGGLFNTCWICIRRQQDRPPPPPSSQVHRANRGCCRPPHCARDGGWRGWAEDSPQRLPRCSPRDQRRPTQPVTT